MLPNLDTRQADKKMLPIVIMRQPDKRMLPSEIKRQPDKKMLLCEITRQPGIKMPKCLIVTQGTSTHLTLGILYPRPSMKWLKKTKLFVGLEGAPSATK
jgi:hypothetical protein